MNKEDKNIMELRKTEKITKQVNAKVIIGILIFSGLIATFNETILNVALSPLMIEMNVTAGTIQWIITAYMIVVAVLVPVTAFLIQTFKTKHLYLTAMIILLFGTICGAYSKTFTMLLISRILQAAGTGMIIPIMMNTVLEVAPSKSRGAVMGLCGASLTLGPALGPTVAGIVLQYYQWNMLFVLLIPIIILAIIVGNIYLVNVSNITKPKIDVLSIILSTISFGGLIYGISGFSEGLNIKLVSIIFIIGILSLILFCKRQLSSKEPMLDIRVFKYKKFTIATVLVMLSMMTIFTMAVMLPMFLQGALETNTFTAAMALLPATLISGALTPVAGKIYDKKGSRILLPTGFIIILVSLFILVDIGVALTMSPSQTVALSSLPKDYYPHGVAILNTLQQLASAIGSSLFIGIMSAVQLKSISNGFNEWSAVASGFNISTLVLSGFVLVAVILSMILPVIKNKKSTVSDYKSDDVINL